MDGDHATLDILAGMHPIAVNHRRKLLPAHVRAYRSKINADALGQQASDDPSMLRPDGKGPDYGGPIHNSRSAMDT